MLIIHGESPVFKAQTSSWLEKQTEIPSSNLEMGYCQNVYYLIILAEEKEDIDE